MTLPAESPERTARRTARTAARTARQTARTARRAARPAGTPGPGGQPQWADLIRDLIPLIRQGMELFRPPGGGTIQPVTPPTPGGPMNPPGTTPAGDMNELGALLRKYFGQMGARTAGTRPGVEARWNRPPTPPVP